MSVAVLYLGPQEFPQDFVLQLYCECTNRLCLERVSITYKMYRNAKTNVVAFVIKPEHYLPEFERLVRKTVNHWIVMKRFGK